MHIIIEPQNIKDYEYRLGGCEEPELCSCYEAGCGGKALCQEEGGEPCPEDCVFYCHYPWYCEAFQCKPTHT